jgi:Small integral membrane protein
MSINWTVVRSVSWLTMAASAVLLLIKVTLAAFGVDFQTDSISNAINLVLGILAGAGFITGTTAAATVSTHKKIDTAVKLFKEGK